MKLVVIESPFAAPTPEGIEANIEYARACVADSLRRGEAPYASHLLYTQPGILRDEVPEEREQGISAGFAWGDRADLRAVYLDRGMSGGMRAGIRAALAAGQPIEFRSLRSPRGAEVKG